MTLPALVRGFVLGGGKSSRMGADKALLDFRGRPLLEHALSVMRQVCPEVAVVGDPGKLAAYGPVIPDVYPGCGPLAGIHAALTALTADLNLIVAVDMPFVSCELLAFLLSTAGDCDALVTVPRTGRGFQPLCAVYRPAFAAIADEALRAGKYKIDALFAGTGFSGTRFSGTWFSGTWVRIIDEQELAAAGFSERNFFNVNTPEDLLSAQSQPIRP